MPRQMSRVGFRRHNKEAKAGCFTVGYLTIIVRVIAGVPCYEGVIEHGNCCFI